MAGIVFPYIWMHMEEEEEEEEEERRHRAIDRV